MGESARLSFLSSYPFIPGLISGALFLELSETKKKGLRNTADFIVYPVTVKTEGRVILKRQSDRSGSFSAYIGSAESMTIRLSILTTEMTKAFVC